MANTELSDILLRSVDDSVNIALETKGYKPHFAMDSDMAFEYNVLLANYLRAKKRDGFSQRVSFREIHKYLLNMTRVQEANPAKKQEDEGDNGNYDMEDGPKIKPVNLESIATKAKNIGTAGLIVAAAAGAYSIIKPALLASAMGLGAVSAGIFAISLYLIYSARKKEGPVEDKSIGNKREMKKAYALIQDMDFMAWGEVLESNRELIAGKLKPVWEKQ